MIDLADTELLFGHTDEDTALYVDDYPYGRRLRTTIRYWIETTPRGDRFVRQTLNPNTDKWNKPKRSTYMNVAVMTRADDPKDGITKVSYTGLNDWPDKDWLAHFCAEVGVERLSDRQRDKLAEVIGRTRAFEHVTFEVKAAPFSFNPTDEEKAAEEARKAEQAEVERKVGMLVAIETAKARESL